MSSGKGASRDSQVLWQRPVPLIGDSTSAAERDDDVAGWAFPEEVREALDRVIGARRDIRRFRPDDVPDDLVRAVVNAGHGGPSVGHSQPWRFIVVRERRTRERVAWLADRERLRQAGQLTPDRAARLLDLQLEGIREAPLGLVVACDRRAPAQGVLGRNTFHDADLWSCACAIENMWLSARAAGLGMGWVTLMRPTDLAGLLGLPDGVETLGWLCLGWPDERPPYPGLERRAWSRKLPLDDVMVAERWPEEDITPPVSALAGHAPATPASDTCSYARVRTPETSPLWSDVVAPTQREVVRARDAADALLTPPGSLGKLDQALDRVVAAAGDQLTGGTLVLVGADHPVAALGISAFDSGVTREVMTAALHGEAVGVVAARAAGLKTRLIDAGVAPQPLDGALDARPLDDRGDLAGAPALSAADVVRLVTIGRDIGTEAAASGLVCLGEVGVGNTTVAAALACALTDLEPSAAVGIGAGSDAAMIARKTDIIGRALSRLDRTELRADPTLALAEVGGPEFAVLAGVVLGATDAGAPVVLDGLATSVAALAVVQVNPAIQPYLIAGQASREFAHSVVLTELGLEPLLDMRLRAGEGVGACLAAQALLTGLAIRRDAGRTR